MANQHNIRWQQSDHDEINKAVKNFNAKITRLEKKYPELKSILPQRVTVKELKELIDTRQDLKREVNALKRFTSRDNKIEKMGDGTFTGIVTIPNNDYNLQTTKWQKEEMTRRVGVINRKRKTRLEQIGNIEVTSRGKPVGYTKSQIGMGDTDEVALTPMQAFTKRMTRTDLNMKYKAIRKESQSNYWTKKEILLKSNVIKSIESNYMGVDPELTSELIQAIDDMPFEEFYARFKAESGVMEIVSPVPGQRFDEAMRRNLEALRSTWMPDYVTDTTNKGV